MERWECFAHHGRHDNTRQKCERGNGGYRRREAQRVGQQARRAILAHRFLNERADHFLFGSGPFLEREGLGPHDALVGVRRVVEAERRVPRVELLRALEEADDLP